MKWIWVIVLVIIGGLAAFVAIEYFTVAIHALPSYIPGQKRGRGHYRKRGAGAALVAFVAFVIAGYLTYRNLRTEQPSSTASGTGAGTGEGSVNQLLSNPPSEPGSAEG